MNAYLRLARPKQWLKNVLVFAAPGAAGVLDSPGAIGDTLLAFAAMSLAASGTYYWNDVLDVDADRAHPTKCRRPIASGSVGVGAGRLVGTLLLVASLGVAAATGRWQTVAVVAVYIAVTLTYSFVWKHIAVIDLIAISSGFVLRAAAGAVAVDVPMSSWFVLVTTFGALFIVTGKRFAEAHELGDGAHAIRSTLGQYSESYLRFVLGVTCAGGTGELLRVGLRAPRRDGRRPPLVRAVDRAGAHRVLPVRLDARAGARRRPRGGLRARSRAPTPRPRVGRDLRRGGVHMSLRTFPTHGRPSPTSTAG
jgi:decaprenyl-phosphate phosphoribosyltransferase